MNGKAIPLAAVILAVLVLSGCGKSAATHFYSLSAQGQPPSAAPPCLSLGVGPVDVPAYLDRRDMVVRKSENRLALSDFEEWAEPVKDGLARVLAQNLSTLVCARPLAVHPWPAGISPDYQATVQVQRFDGAPGGEAALEASWSILDREGNLLAWNRFSGRTACGPDHSAMAAAMSRLAADLSADMAASLKALAAAPPGRKPARP